MTRYLAALLVLLAVLAGGYVWMMRTPFPKAILLADRPFDRVEVVAARGTSNVFYAPKGQEMATALEFVQLIAFDKDVPEENRRISMTYQNKSYGLKAAGPESDEYFGTFQRGGVKMTSYATVITLKTGSAFIVHVQVQEATFDEAAAEAATSDEVAALRALAPQLEK